MVAALYAVGTRLDSERALLFVLRQVDPTGLLLQALNNVAALDRGRALDDDLGDLFNIVAHKRRR